MASRIGNHGFGSCRPVAAHRRKLPEAAGSGVSAPPLAVAAAVACLAGVLAIRTFHAMLASRSLHHFAPYLWAVGAALLWFGSRP